LDIAWQDDRGRDQRASERSPADLVNTRDEIEAAVPKRLLVGQHSPGLCCRPLGLLHRLYRLKHAKGAWLVPRPFMITYFGN
jgi:hypothetical protein